MIEAWNKKIITNSEACYCLLEYFVAGADRGLLQELPEDLYDRFVNFINRMPIDDESTLVQDVKETIGQLRELFKDKSESCDG